MLSAPLDIQKAGTAAFGIKRSWIIRHVSSIPTENIPDSRPAAFVTWMKEITYHQCTRYFRKKTGVKLRGVSVTALLMLIFNRNELLSYPVNTAMRTAVVSGAAGIASAAPAAQTAPSPSPAQIPDRFSGAGDGDMFELLRLEGGKVIEYLDAFRELRQTNRDLVRSRAEYESMKGSRGGFDTGGVLLSTLKSALIAGVIFAGIGLLTGGRSGAVAGLPGALMTSVIALIVNLIKEASYVSKNRQNVRNKKTALEKLEAERAGLSGTVKNLSASIDPGIWDIPQKYLTEKSINTMLTYYDSGMIRTLAEGYRLIDRLFSVEMKQF